MSRFAGYVILSVGLVVYMVTNAHFLHGEFFPTVVSLTNSRVFSVAIANAFFALFCLFGVLMARLFFGTLAQVERHNLAGGFTFHIFDTIIALSYFRDALSTEIAVMFCVNTMSYMFHVMAEGRQENLEVANPHDRKSAFKLGILLLILMVIDFLFFLFFGSSVIRNGYSVLVLFAFEFLIRLLSAVATSVRLLLHQIELYKGHVWERKMPLKFYCNITYELLTAALRVIYFAARCSRGQVPLHLVPQLASSIRSAIIAIHNFSRFRVLSRVVNLGLPAATHDQLEADRICSICYDDMEDNTNAKRLPCGHCFHYQCLRMWIQKNATCPYCRSNFDLRLLERRAAFRARMGQGQPDQEQPGPQARQERPAQQQAPQARAAAPQIDEEVLREAYHEYLKAFAAGQQPNVRPSANRGPPQGAPARAPSPPPSKPSLPSRPKLSLLPKQSPPAPSAPDASPDVPVNQPPGSVTAEADWDSEELAAYRAYKEECAAANRRLNDRLMEIDVRRSRSRSQSEARLD